MDDLLGCLFELLIEFIFNFLLYLLLNVFFYFLFIKDDNPSTCLAAGIVSTLIAGGSGWLVTRDLLGGNPQNLTYVWLLAFVGFSFNAYRMFSHYTVLSMSDGHKVEPG